MGDREELVPSFYFEDPNDIYLQEQPEFNRNLSVDMLPRSLSKLLDRTLSLSNNNDPESSNPPEGNLRASLAHGQENQDHYDNQQQGEQGAEAEISVNMNRNPSIDMMPRGFSDFLDANIKIEDIPHQVYNFQNTPPDLGPRNMSGIIQDSFSKEEMQSLMLEYGASTEATAAFIAANKSWNNSGQNPNNSNQQQLDIQNIDQIENFRKHSVNSSPPTATAVAAATAAAAAVHGAKPPHPTCNSHFLLQKLQQQPNKTTNDPDFLSKLAKQSSDEKLTPRKQNQKFKVNKTSVGVHPLPPVPAGVKKPGTADITHRDKPPLNFHVPAGAFQANSASVAAFHAAPSNFQGSSSNALSPENDDDDYDDCDSESRGSNDKTKSGGKGTRSKFSAEERKKRRAESNRLSAERSRERRKYYVRYLESAISGLQGENQELKTTISKYENRIKFLESIIQMNGTTHQILSLTNTKDTKNLVGRYAQKTQTTPSLPLQNHHQVE